MVNTQCPIDNRLYLLQEICVTNSTTINTLHIYTSIHICTDNHNILARCQHIHLSTNYTFSNSLLWQPLKQQQLNTLANNHRTGHLQQHTVSHQSPIHTLSLHHFRTVITFQDQCFVYQLQVFFVSSNHIAYMALEYQLTTLNKQIAHSQRADQSSSSRTLQTRLNNRLIHLIQTLLQQIQLRKPRIGINNQYHSYTSNYSLLDPSHKLHPTDLQQRTGIDHWTALGLQLTKPTSTMKKATTTTLI